MLNLNKKPGDALTASEINQMGGGIDALEVDVSGIKDKGSLHDLFLASGATYNEETKMYQLNGLDLTFEEMLECYKYTEPLLYTLDWSQLCNSAPIKTNVEKLTTVGVNTIVKMDTTFIFCTNLKVVDFIRKKNNGYMKVSTLSRAFEACKNLNTVIGLNLINCKTTIDAFKFCSYLQTVQLNNLKINISFNDSPLLTKESIIFLIQNATPSSAIIITLHPTAYAMATADPDIQAELEKQPNISLAEGTPSV